MNVAAYPEVDALAKRCFELPAFAAFTSIQAARLPALGIARLPADKPLSAAKRTEAFLRGELFIADAAQLPGEIKLPCARFGLLLAYDRDRRRRRSVVGNTWQSTGCRLRLFMHLGGRDASSSMT